MNLIASFFSPFLFVKERARKSERVSAKRRIKLKLPSWEMVLHGKIVEYGVDIMLALRVVIIITIMSYQIIYFRGPPHPPSCQWLRTKREIDRYPKPRQHHTLSLPSQQDLAYLPCPFVIDR